MCLAYSFIFHDYLFPSVCTIYHLYFLSFFIFLFFTFIFFYSAHMCLILSLSMSIFSTRVWIKKKLADFFWYILRIFLNMHIRYRYTCVRNSNKIDVQWAESRSRESRYSIPPLQIQIIYFLPTCRELWIRIRFCRSLLNTWLHVTLKFALYLNLFYSYSKGCGSVSGLFRSVLNTRLYGNY